MASLKGDPVPSSPEEALEALERDLPKALQGKSIDEAGWQRPDPLTLLIPLWANKETGSPDLYLLKLQFGYYPTSPPSAQFVNPITRTYSFDSDSSWLPRIEGNPRIQIHAKYEGNGRTLQLICSSMTLEFYQVSHAVKEADVWNPEHRNFAATINEIKAGLQPPWYRGRMG